ncbi:trans-sulfuration enzyme family protein [candidate division KSB1 bacterium]
MGKKKEKSKKEDKKNSIGKESRLIHGPFTTPKWEYSHHVVPPLSASVTYRLDTVERGFEGFDNLARMHSFDAKKKPIFLYDRLDEPTRSMLEDQIAYAEDGEVAFCFATGMAAISAAVLFSAKQGDEVIFHKTMYGCTYSLSVNWMPKFGIKASYIDMTDPKNLQKALNPNVRSIYFESPANPTMELIDLKAIANVIEKANKDRPKGREIISIIDNTFATPRCQRPLNHGITMVVHSLTKNIGGFGTDMGGVIITSKKYESEIMLYRKDMGGVLGSKNAWSILVYGLPTLLERGRKQQESAIKVAEFLEKHPKIEKVRYPGLKSFPQYKIAKKQMIDFDGNFAPGNMIYFTMKKDDEKKCNKLLNTIAKEAYAITLAVSLGHVRTLIEKPGSLTHSMIPEKEQKNAKMDKSGARLSIGLENVEDIIKDLKYGLSKI